VTAELGEGKFKTHQAEAEGIHSPKRTERLSTGGGNEHDGGGTKFGRKKNHLSGACPFQTKIKRGKEKAHNAQLGQCQRKSEKGSVHWGFVGEKGGSPR